MKKLRIIPRIDIKNNNLVKGIQLEGLRVMGDPSKFVNHYIEEGADEIFGGYLYFHNAPSPAHGSANPNCLGRCLMRGSTASKGVG